MHGLSTQSAQQQQGSDYFILTRVKLTNDLDV